MSRRLAAGFVHLLTASGAGLALLALLAATRGDYHAMFVWLGIALLLDAIDGPIARLVQVEVALPRFSGERLDLVVDYFTYVAVPAYALATSFLLPDGFRIPAAILILISSLYHFADTMSKTEDGFFVGFPAIWNIVLLHLFVLGLPAFLALVGVVVLAALTFVPIPVAHPFRLKGTRVLAVVAIMGWGGAAILALLNPFPSPLYVQLLLIGGAVILLGIGTARYLFGEPIQKRR